MNKNNSKQRVLFICPQPFFEWRGSPIRVKFNVLALSQLGYEVDLLTLPIGKDEKVENVKIIRAWNILGSKEISIGPSLLKLWFAFILLIQGASLVLRNRYDVLHGTEEAGFICYLLSFICRAKCVFEKHSDADSYQPSLIMKPVLALYEIAEKLTIRGSKAVISTGPALDEQARSWDKGPHKANKFSVIPDIPSSMVEASPETTKEVRNKLTEDPDKVIITYAGSFASYQGIDLIFDAMPDIVHQASSALFVIIGGTEQEIKTYKGQLSDQGVTEQVLFLGKIAPDLLPAYLAASDILLAPRKSGVNSPLKLLDYFKAKSAIVATSTTANKRLLNSKNSVMCEFSAGDFTDAIVDLIKSPEKRQSLGEEAHKLYRAKYNFSVFKQQLEQAFKALLNDPKVLDNSPNAKI